MSRVGNLYIGRDPSDAITEANEARIRTLAALRQHKWDLRFLDLARIYASFSKDPSTKTGAVIVNDDLVPVGFGYNGFARGVKDLPERYENRELKYKMVVHCERNAMQFAQRDIRGCTLYTWPFMSCAPCAAHVINAGISRVVAPKNDNPRWKADFDLSEQMFREAGVVVDLLEIPTWLGLPYRGTPDATSQVTVSAERELVRDDAPSVPN